MKINEILKVYGKDYTDMTMRLLSKANLEEHILNKKNDKNLRITIKPNLVSCTPASYGATTHPEVVEGIIRYLQKCEFSNICIMEGSWVGDKTSEAFEYCGYNELSRKYGVELVDTQPQQAVKVDSSGLELNISKCVFDTDFMINVPVLKGHCTTKITCALKNMKGLIPNSEKKRFHTMGLHGPIAHLNSIIKQDFIVVDHICGDPNFEGGSEPWQTDCVMAGCDPVLIDTYVCNIFKITPQDVPYVRIAEEMGIGSTDLNDLKVYKLEKEGLVEEALDAEETPKTHNMLSIKSIIEDYNACSTCYAGCIEALNRLSEEGIEFGHKICLGQAYRGQEGMYGVGNCTMNFTHTVKGCPPSADKMYEEIKKWCMEE